VVLTCSFAVFVWGICALTRSAGEARDGGLFRLVAVFRPWSRACGSGCFPAGPQAAASLCGRGQAGQHVITAADPLPDDLRQALDAINHTG
jgi:hypothetical protein